MKHALELERYETIKQALLNDKESSLNDEQKFVLKRWVTAANLLELYPVKKHIVKLLRKKYPVISQRQAYDDCFAAEKLFNSRFQADPETIRHWAINNIIEDIRQLRKMFKADPTRTKLAQTITMYYDKLIKLVGEDKEQKIDPSLLEKNQFFTVINVNGESVKMDNEKLLSLPVEEKMKLTELLDKPIDDQQADQILNS